MVKVVIHCSDSSWGNAAIISKWHVMKPPDGRGWSNIGYHYVILNGQLAPKIMNDKYNGHVETGRPLDDDNMILPEEWGAHVAGHNKNSVGVCLIGRSGNFTVKQVNALFALVKDLRAQFGEIEVQQHSDLDPDNKPHCAGFNLFFIDQLNTTT